LASSLFPYLALLLAIPLTIAAFALKKPHVAAITVLLGSMMFLPEAVSMDLPLVPYIDKHRIACLCIFVALLSTSSRRIDQAELFQPIDWILLILPFFDIWTILTNLDGFQAGPRFVPGHVLKDILARILATGLDFCAPFLIGRIIFRRLADAQDLLRVMATAGLFYVPFILIEFQVGPEFHLWVYGYRQGSIDQAIRGTGFRPVVFMIHGLAVAIFMYTVTISSAISAAYKTKIFGLSARAVSIFYTILFPFLKSSAALMYTMFTLPAVLFLKPKAQTKLAAVIVSFALIYQVVRITDAVDVWKSIDLMSKVFGAERAGSMGFRMLNENLLRDRALERPWFGWGGYGRGHIFDAAGNDISVTDGYWIILLGDRGLVGLTAAFGLLAGPVFLARRRLPKMDPKAQTAVAGLALVQSFTVTDLLPNGMFSPLPLVLAGAIAGLALGIPKDRGNQYLPLLLAWYWRRTHAKPLLRRD
jgi:hypothetical protein